MPRTGITELDIATPHADQRRDLRHLVALALAGRGVHPAAIRAGREPVLPGSGADRGSPPEHLVTLKVMDR